MTDQVNEVAEAISKLVNKMSGSRDIAKSLGKQMANDHRTLVQTKMLIILEFLKELNTCYETNRYDARNEASCKLANKMLDALSPEDIEYIPYI